MHIPRKPGEQIEVDWAGDPAQLIDPDTGEITEAWIFVGVLTYSQYTFVKAYLNQKTDNWIKVHIQIGLTGTPSSNGLMDLFAEYKCLDMGDRLGRFITQYRSNYFLPDKMNGPVVYSYKLRPGAEDRIYDAVSDITISMKALDHLKMPELISNRYMVYMDQKEQQDYDDMCRDKILPLVQGEVTAANAAALSGKLVQMANGAVYDDGGIMAQINNML